MIKSELIWPLTATLGEGPVWLDDERALWFVDIKQGHLHRHRPETGACDTFVFGGRPSFVVPVSGGGMIVGDGATLVRGDGGRRGAIVGKITMPPGNRTNDATVDSKGCLWFGTMDDGENESTGRIYRFDGKIREMGGACVISNGPAISPDGGSLYHVDSAAGLVWRFTIDTGGLLTDGNILIRCDISKGHPDGVVVDSEGCLWIGMWGGWCVRRYSDQGEFMADVPLPCANVTKIAFGGEDLLTAYVTTARAGLSKAALIDQPLAGGLFAFAAPVAGLPVNRVVLPGD
jgi:xylono-1,5-lactonase